jgi:hypothetical protein
MAALEIKIQISPQRHRGHREKGYGRVCNNKGASKISNVN